MQRTTILLLTILLVAFLLLAGAYTLVELRSMGDSLALVSTRLRALEEMNAKLSETNRLLKTTNANLRTMIATSGSADRKLAAMSGDLATMSHKISGSFLFRGVK